MNDTLFLFANRIFKQYQPIIHDPYFFKHQILMQKLGAVGKLGALGGLGGGIGGLGGGGLGGGGLGAGGLGGVGAFG
jgi:hypothetical protein